MTNPKVKVPSLMAGALSLGVLIYAMSMYFVNTFGVPTTISELYNVILTAQGMVPYAESAGLIAFTMLLVATPIAALFVVPMLVSKITYLLFYGLHRLYMRV